MSWNHIPSTIWLSYEHQAIECSKYLLSKPDFALDEESSGLNKFTDVPLIFSFSDGIERFACMTDIMYLPSMKELVESNKSKIGSNIGHVDKHWAENVGIYIKGSLYDTVTMDWLVDESREGRHGLKDCAWDYCGIAMKEFTEVFPMKRATKDSPAETPRDAILKKISTEEGFTDTKQYAGLDAYANYKVYEYLKARLKEEIVFVDENGKPNWTLWDHFLTFEVPFANVLYNIERRGMKISTGYLKQMSSMADRKLKEIETSFHRTIKEKGYDKFFERTINLNSSAQLKKLFYDIEGKIPFKFTKKGEPSTDSEVIERFSEEGNQLAIILAKYKEIIKAKTAFLDGLQEQVCPDGKVHPTFRSVTVSGRLSCTDPNVQNIKKKEEDEFVIRAAFIAEEGYVLVVYDYSQLELFLLAHIANDEIMIEAFKNGKDLHLIAVSLIFGYDYDECVAAKKKDKKYGTASLTKRELTIVVLRSAVKRIWYGLNYGIGDEKLANNLTLDFRSVDPEARNKQCPACLTIYPIDYEGNCRHLNSFPVDELYINPSLIKLRNRARKGAQAARLCSEEFILETILRTVSEKEASIYREKLLGVFKGAKSWLEEQVRLVNREKQVQSLLGRFRRLRGVDSTNLKDKSRAERQAKNVIQNNAADVMKVVMIAIEEDEELKRLDTTMISQVHDELIFKVPEDKSIIDKAMIRIQYLMENSFDERIFPLKVKLKVEGNWGYDWASCK